MDSVRERTYGTHIKQYKNMIGWMTVKKQFIDQCNLNEDILIKIQEYLLQYEHETERTWMVTRIFMKNNFRYRLIYRLSRCDFIQLNYAFENWLKLVRCSDKYKHSDEYIEINPHGFDIDEQPNTNPDANYAYAWPYSLQFAKWRKNYEKGGKFVKIEINPLPPGYCIKY